MEKSQLRQLALDHAQGELAFEDYVRERGELIDAIVGGKLAISRQAASAHDPSAGGPSNDETMRLAPPERAGGAFSPAYVGIGVVVIIAVIAGAMMLGNREQAPTAPPVLPPEPPAVAEKPPAEKLVSEFVAENNWNEASTQSFLERWQALGEKARSDARAAPWFSDLTTSLRQEINARHALASLPGGSADRIDGQRLVGFARALEVGGQYPDFGAASSTASTAATAPQATAQDGAPAATSPGTQAPPTADSATSAPSAAAQAADSGNVAADTLAADTPADGVGNAAEATADSAVADMPPSAGPASPTDVNSEDGGAAASAQWFQSLPDSHHTLQLFVVTRLAEIQKLEAEHPDIDLHYLASTGTNGRTFYRVVHGDFADEDSAKSAFERLPAVLRKDQRFPLVQSVGDLRRRMATQPAAAGRSGAADQVAAADAYTLQLFVFGQLDNAQKLLKQFPDLPLWVHSTAASPLEHRVLFGRYENAEVARTAGSSLPESLREQAGVPVVKRVKDPAGPGISRE